MTWLYFLLICLTQCLAFNITNLFTSEEIIKIKSEKTISTLANIMPFPCKPLKINSNSSQDASKLKFSDIKVMMALGDSMTAGFGMKDKRFVDWVYEYRGYSALIGADPEAPTVYNYFKKIGNDMKGGSLKYSLIWNRDPKIDHLNGAISRARVEQVQPQITYIINQAKQEPGVDYQNDWKILNIIIGGNNLFKCDRKEAHPDEFEKRMNETLSRIHNEIPKVFVNLFMLFEKAMVDTYNNGKQGLYCSTLFRFLGKGFPCLVTTDELRAKMVEYAKEYNKRMEKLSKWWNQNRKRKDFYIGLQPIFQLARSPDSSYSSQYDCFHPSAKANAEISITAWNSLQLPWEKKPRANMNRFICPDENTLVQ